jgi:hypothetical protein
MNTKNILFVVSMAAAFAVVVAPSLMATASAQPTTVCVKNGHIAPGQTQENTPPGKASCPDAFKARPAQSVR